METPTPTTGKKSSRTQQWKPTDGFGRFGAQVITDRIAKMLSHSREVRRGTDVEAVHDMRVASRRLRAAIEVFEPAFRGPSYERLEREVKLITDSLSHARDLDVMMGDLTADAARLPVSQRGVATELVRKWGAERRRIQGDVVAALNRLAERDPEGLFREAAGVTSDARPLDRAVQPEAAPADQGADA
ncbi:MAG: CHAD domain-containing protein [Armatimonadetes bacterium]|nr:CHAD domain-containing protein [Armatimonadota bacterium]